MTLPWSDRVPLPLIPRPRTISRRLRSEASARFDLAVIEELRSWSNLRFDNFEPIPGSSRGDNLLADTESSRLLIKRYKNTVSGSMIEHEHSILLHLESIGFPAPRLVLARHGGTFIEISGRRYAIFVYESGYFHYHEYIWPPSRYLKFVARSGRALGALHGALAGFSPAGSNPNALREATGSRERDIPWHLDRIQQARRAAPGLNSEGADELRAILATSAADIEERLIRLDSELNRADLSTTVIHGDYGPYNVMFRRGEPVFVLDFEMARTDWRITDVAKSFQQFGLTRSGPRWERMTAFLGGYRAESPLGRDEAALIPVAWEFLSLRRVIVSSSEYCVDHRADRLTEARRKLELAAMIRNSPKRFDELAAGGSA